MNLATIILKSLFFFKNKVYNNIKIYDNIKIGNPFILGVFVRNVTNVLQFCYKNITFLKKSKKVLTNITKKYKIILQ